MKNWIKITLFVLSTLVVLMACMWFVNWDLQKYEQIERNKLISCDLDCHNLNMTFYKIEKNSGYRSGRDSFYCYCLNKGVPINIGLTE